MSSRSAFPTFRSHDSVVCFKEGHRMPVGSEQVSGYPPGSGFYCKRCPVCDCNTYYDLKEQQETK